MIFQNELPELPVLEGAELGRRISQYEPSQAPLAETTPEKDENKKNEIVTETGNFNAKRNTFEQLEEESLKVKTCFLFIYLSIFHFLCLAYCMVDHDNIEVSIISIVIYISMHHYLTDMLGA